MIDTETTIPQSTPLFVRKHWSSGNGDGTVTNHSQEFLIVAWTTDGRPVGAPLDVEAPSLVVLDPRLLGALSGVGVE